MKNHFGKNHLIRVLLVTLVLTLLLSGCASGGDNILTFKFKGKKYDLNDGLLAFVQKASKNEKYVIDLFCHRILEVKDGKLEHSSDDLMTMGIKALEYLMVSIRYLEEDQAFTLEFNRDENLSKVSTAEGISAKSKKKDVPGYFISLGSFDSPGSRRATEAFMAVAADGKAYDLSSYVEDLPEEITDDYLQKVNEKTSKMGACFFLFPNSTVGWNGLVKDHAKEEGFRNTFAIINALYDLYESYQEGDVKTIGTIGIGFDEKGLSGIEYNVFGEKEDTNLFYAK